MTDIEYYERIRNLLMVAGDHFKREADHHRLTHETKKRLAVSKKAKFEQMQPHGCLAKFAKGDAK